MSRLTELNDNPSNDKIYRIKIEDIGNVIDKLAEKLEEVRSVITSFDDFVKSCSRNIIIDTSNFIPRKF